MAPPTQLVLPTQRAGSWDVTWGGGGGGCAGCRFGGEASKRIRQQRRDCGYGGCETIEAAGAVVGGGAVVGQLMVALACGGGAAVGWLAQHRRRLQVLRCSGGWRCLAGQFLLCRCGSELQVSIV